MASDSIAHSAFGLMGYWLRAHSGSRNKQTLKSPDLCLYRLQALPNLLTTCKSSQIVIK